MVHRIYKQPSIASLSQSTLGFSISANRAIKLYGPSSLPPKAFAIALIDALKDEFDSLNQEFSLDNITRLLCPRDSDRKHELDKASKREASLRLAPVTQGIIYGLAKNANLKYLRLNKSVSSPTQESLQKQQLSGQSEYSEMEIFEGVIEEWFKQSQNRSSGVYKRNSKFVLFWIGLAVALIINVNSLHMIGNLYQQNSIRKATSEAAIDATKNCEELDQCADQIKDALDLDELPLGWSSDHSLLESIWVEDKGFDGDNKIGGDNRTIERILGVAYNILGWSITAIAVMMGPLFGSIYSTKPLMHVMLHPNLSQRQPPPPNNPLHQSHSALGLDSTSQVVSVFSILT